MAPGEGRGPLTRKAAVTPGVARKHGRASRSTGTHRLTTELRLRRASAAPENTGARRCGVWNGIDSIEECGLVGRADAPASQL